ncbi:DoxX family membrane protein [Erythrobacter insulae]|uniref:NADH:ubiquinone reductase (non-electrogenic) n=1 Tax=Erythrobacter insulae TaxID=2584124 RepID=A0A547PE29_9SPHN|nr:FAD-dependent oxidoreductase [Erythrobacter insulae]TRD12401.1 DoxX family membrane protein [Erythrobacter insulae]
MSETGETAQQAGRELLQEERLPPFVRVTLRRWAKWYSGGAELFWPFTDIAVRFFVAVWFLRSGLVKLSDWDTALYLAANEYPVSWMSASNAAIIGLSIELVGPLLFLAGFFTRPAALAMAALTVISQAVYIPTTTNLMVISILAWYVISGPAAFSFDRVLASGLKHSALPLARPLIKLGDWSRAEIGPAAMMAIRIWLTIALLAYADVFEPSIGLATWLPTSVFVGIPAWLAIAFAALFLTGFAASIVSYALVLVIGFTMIAGAHPNVTLFPFLLLGIYESRGAGRLSFDSAIWAWMEKNILFDRDYSEIPGDWPHIVVVGAGFGGLAAVERLKRLPVRITLIDKRNYHLFQPLLYQVATATLNPADIATPIRSLFRADGNVRVIKGEVREIDSKTKTITHGAVSGEKRELGYDRLVLATGATHSYFGNEEWSALAPGLKTIEDGVAVRASILNAFEQAEATEDQNKIRRLLTFVIVGGGPTGVELAGAIAELAKVSVAREFRTVDPATAQVILVQSGDRILPAFSAELSLKASESLENLGVEIRTGGRVTHIANEQVRIDDASTIETETVLWAAGVKASPAAKWLGTESDRAGRVPVNDHLRVHGPDGVLDDVFAIGDTANSNGWGGNMVPGLAPAAKQGGIYVSQVVEAELLNKQCPGPFVYKHQGSLATIGRKSAVADFGMYKLSGNIAWWLWGVVHLGFLTGMRNRVTVTINWIWSFFAHHSGVRLITEKQV